MGGEIELFDTCLGGPACRFHDSSAKHSAVVRGVSKLQGADVTIPDVRAGFSSVIAAAAAEGASTLHGIHHLERGYNAPVRDARVARPAPHPRLTCWPRRLSPAAGWPAPRSRRSSPTAGEDEAAGHRGPLQVALAADLRRPHERHHGADRHGSADGQHQIGQEVLAQEHRPRLPTAAHGRLA